MSQSGPKSAASPRSRHVAAASHTQEQVNEKNTGSSLRSGEKKGSDEKKAAILGSSQPSRAHAGGAATTTKVPASSAATSKFPSMSTTEAKAIPVCKMEGPHPPDKKRHRKQAMKTESEKSQSNKPSVAHEKKSQERKPKESSEPPNLPSHASDAGSKHAHKEKAVSKSNEKMVSEKSAEPKTKSQDAPVAAGESVVSSVSVAAASDKADGKKKEKKSSTPASRVESKPNKPPGKSGMDAALDDLIDTLGEPEETNKDEPQYTGPIVLDPMDSTYIEALGIREGTIPPEYRKFLANKEGITGPPPDSSKPMGPDDAIDALSSDFTCSSPTGKQTEKEKSTGDVFKAQSAGVTRSAIPPQEKKRKVEEDVMSDQALQALSDSLGTRQPDPEIHLSQAEQVKEAKAKEERQEKCGEDDDTVPSQFRLKPAMDKDGKPLLPEPEEKSKCLSEAELVGQLSEDFGRSAYQDKPSLPAEKIEKSKDTSPAPVAEAVPRASMCSIQSVPPKPASLGMVPDDAVETLAGSLGEREVNPEDEKPVVDKLKEKSKEEDREKLGEKEETIPPDYRLEEVKDKDGKPLLPKELKEQLPPLSDDFLLDALSQDFSSPENIPSLEFEDAKLSAAISEVVSKTPAPNTNAAAPPPDTEHRDKDLNDALDELSDSLGERQPDPDENKPVDDKVKEKVKAEHSEKLGEREDTIPPDYRHLLDDDGQGKPEKPPTKKSKKPDHDQDPIDALSQDLDSCPSTTENSQHTGKEKSKKMGSNSKAPKNGVKTKDSSKGI
ncbi:calpastatin isoform X3 [Cricetulus griseus]|uniref:calpastatin isoform X3 n=1 Tax=Cricetulus griseus TaxID=10029 RepID=UPI00045478A3|nr:calpastatin isoform X3 [Cricetulus griseus]